MKKVLFLVSVVIFAILMAASVSASETQPWPGDADVYASDLTFSSNSSGLDFRDGKLYSVDNGEGSLYVMEVTREGSIKFADGFESGVSIGYKTRSYNCVPDAEGVSTDDNGFVYIAAERDNSGSDSLNMVLKVDPLKTPNNDNIIQADRDWDLTSAMPSVGSNKGIEAVEWVSFEDVNGKILDKNTGKVFDSSDYPDSDSNGVVFVGLEKNGHIYGFVLNSDGSSVLLCDIASGFDGIMALDYDEYENVLWAVTDDNFDNMAAKLTFNGTDTPDSVKYLAPDSLDTSDNNEGFAIADHTYTVEGRRPVFRLTDGPTKGALIIGTVFCDYEVHECLAFEWVIVKEPSCANGLKEKRCIECGNVIETEVIASLYGHNNNSQVAYATRINAEGRKELYCKICELVIDIDATNISLVFEDTPHNTWYGDAVGYIYTLGYMGSTSPDRFTFEPATNTSRAMFVTILGRYKNVNIENYTPTESGQVPFRDVENNKWYTPYVYWAQQTGVVMGYPDGNFGVNDNITREQIVSILFRVAKTPYTIDPDSINSFSDAADISGYAEEPFMWAVTNGIVSGTSKTTLSPKKNASRAEIAQLMVNAIDSGMLVK
ncbi:MAG: S-layer homology domain-containing protein [Ruminococcaceae bacterium]|nr:S-layer homology domain-containing protein [Oscillospiraceae bacterium]